MIDKLVGYQKVLAEYMSELSEEAYSAGWMDGLEYALWNCIVNGPSEYGRLQISGNHIETLLNLSHQSNGWIFWDDELEETFVGISDWKKMFKDNISSYQKNIT